MASNSVSIISKISCDKAQINKLKYVSNTKGNTLITDNSSNLVELPVGTNNQVLTADSTNVNGVKWATLPSISSINVSNLTGSILTYASTTSYVLFNPHTVVLGDVTNTYAEIQYVPYASTLICLDIVPAGNANWPAGTNYTFTVGYLRGTVNTNPPDQFSSVTVTTCSFVPIASANLIVGNAYSGTRTSATAYFNLPILADENLTIRCVNGAATAGTILTATIWLKTTI